MSEPCPEGPVRGGPQIIPRPPHWRVVPGSPWEAPSKISLAGVRAALTRRPEPPLESVHEVPLMAGPRGAPRPAAVLCALFEEAGQAHVVLTRRSSMLRSHTHQVAFPGGRIEPGEDAAVAALREAREEVGIDPASVEIIGRLSALRTVTNPAPITPFVAVLERRPLLRPNPAEVERAFSVALVELMDPDVYRRELWTFADGTERAMHFFELIGDTVWGATARMLFELLQLVAAS